MTLTFCIDGNNTGLRPRVYTNRLAKRMPLRSIRICWLWIAVAWYRFDDQELVQYAHGWSE